MRPEQTRPQKNADPEPPARSLAGSSVGADARPEDRSSSRIRPRLTALSYGGTAAIVTSMGLIVGLGVGESRAALVSSLLLVALADNLTDSLAIHIYQESEKLEAHHAFRSTVGNFIARFLVAISFVLLAIVLPAGALLPVVLTWGLLLLSCLTYLVARGRGAPPFSEVAKHLALAILVIGISRTIGAWIVTHVH